MESDRSTHCTECRASISLHYHSRDPLLCLSAMYRSIRRHDLSCVRDCCSKFAGIDCICCCHCNTPILHDVQVEARYYNRKSSQDHSFSFHSTGYHCQPSCVLYRRNILFYVPPTSHHCKWLNFQLLLLL